jgi:hypothetical protein
MENIPSQSRFLMLLYEGSRLTVYAKPNNAAQFHVHQFRKAQALVVHLSLISTEP